MIRWRGITLAAAMTVGVVSASISQQVADMEMNAPVAAQNPQFLLNVMHWLVGLLPER